MTLGPGPGSFLEKFNPLTGQVIWRQNIAISGGINCGRYNRADRCTYLVDGNGVLKFDPQGRQLGSILDLKQQSILGFETVVTGINVAKGAQYPLIYLINLNQQVRNLYNSGQPVAANGKPYNIYQYSYVPKLPKERNQKVITISTLMPDRFLETAISAYQSKHPGIKIELKSFVNGNIITKVEMEQFVKSVSAELMAGKGPDILSLGSSPFQKLADRNVLVDLGALMAKDKSFDRNKYYSNILDACKYKDGLSVLPVFIQFDALELNPEILDKAGVRIDDTRWNWDEFLKVAEKVSLDINGDGRPEQFALPNMDRLRLFNWMFETQYSSFIDREKKKAYFDTPEFIGLLNLCKTFSDKQLMSTQADPNASQFKIIINGQLMDKGAISTVAFTPTTVFGYSSLLGAKTTFHTARLLSLPGNGAGSGFETPLGMLFGINRKSKLQKEAWEFLKYLLSDEAQTFPGAMGFAVNKDAQRKRAAAEIDRETAQEIANPLNESDMEQVDRLITNLRQLNNNFDPQMIAIIDDELRPFFSGQKSASEVAKLIQSKATTYLQE
ncbi:MAG TPA: extracellular solute-binding protein, partial [Bacillota bacterium]